MTQILLQRTVQDKYVGAIEAVWEQIFEQFVQILTSHIARKGVNCLYLSLKLYFRIKAGNETKINNEGYKLTFALGLTLRNQRSFESKFDDTRLSSWYKNKIVPLKFVLLHPDIAICIIWGKSGIIKFEFKTISVPKCSS